jgi:hypothetical protein
MQTRSKLAVWAFAACGALVISACGSSASPANGGTSSSTGAGSTSAAAVTLPTWDMTTANNTLKQLVGTYPTASGHTTTGINGTTIKVGCDSSNTASGAPTVLADFCAGVKARLQQASQKKEVPYTFDVTSSDDNGSIAATQVTDLTKDVDTNHDFAVFLASGTGPVGTTLLEQKHVPYFGDFIDCGKNAIFGFDISFDIQPCGALLSETGGKELTFSNAILKAFVTPTHQSISDVRVGEIGYNQPQIVQYIKALAFEYAAGGAKVVAQSYSLPANSAATVDLTPYVQPVVAAKPNFVGLFSADYQLTARLMAAFKQAGYTGKFSGDFSQSELQNPTVAQEIDGGLSTSTGTGFPGFGGKYWANLDTEAAAQGTTDSIGFFNGWVTADEFVDGLISLGKAGTGLTAEALVNLMNHDWTYPGYGDVSAPTIYPYGKYAAAPCAAMASMSASKQKELPYQDLTCGTQFFKKIG